MERGYKECHPDFTSKIKDSKFPISLLIKSFHLFSCIHYLHNPGDKLVWLSLRRFLRFL